MSPERVVAEIDGRSISLSNLEKVLYPRTGFTKGALIDYYARIAEVMVPHLCDRPVTLRRFPDGVAGESFFEKHVPRHAPEWVRTLHVVSRASGARAAKGGAVDYAVVDDRPALIWAANLAAIEFHVPLWRADPDDRPRPPDHLVFDLDPGRDTSIVECCQIAAWLRERLEAERLDVMAKTSGSKGLQLYAPVTGALDAEAARDRAHELAQAVERDHGELVVTNMRKELREKKVLIDWSQNNPNKTTVAVYSLRAVEEPRVSTPVTWEEVGACVRSGDPESLRFLPADVLERVERHGDLFAPLLS